MRWRIKNAAASFNPRQEGAKAMAHLAAILFFSGLLVALGLILELIVKANWAEIVAALKGVPAEPLPARPAAEPRLAGSVRRRAAA